MTNENFVAQPLNVRPYSKYATILFIFIHFIAALFHTASLISGLALTPADVLLYPLAELTSTQTEIVGPCLGVTSKSSQDCPNVHSISTLANLKITNAGTGCAHPLTATAMLDGQPVADVEIDVTITNQVVTELKFVPGKEGTALDCTKSYTIEFTGPNCDANPTADVECSTTRPFKMGSMAQPSCNANTIDSSCGVDERHREIKFSIDTGFDNKKQVFNEINIFGLFVWVDLISIVFHGYAILITYTSGFQDAIEAIGGLFSSGKDVSKNRLEHPSDEMLEAPHYPRAPEYNRRWVDISLTYSIITIATALSLGITNFFQLAFLFLGVQVISLLGFLVDDFRYQLRITDADAWNRHHIFEQIKTKLDEDVELKSLLNKQRALDSGWTQPARNVIFCIGLQIIIWYFITLQFDNAADSIIIQMGKDKSDADGLGNDAFVMLATVYKWLTGILGFFQVLILFGDMVADDRTRAHKDPPGNFLLDEIDGDACFVVIMFITKIVVTWFTLATITEVYNFAGGLELRNKDKTDSYLDKGLDASATRTVMLVLGICFVGLFSLLIWMLTPSSLVYERFGKTLESWVCICVKPENNNEKQQADADNTEEEEPDKYRKQIYF